MVLAKVMEEVSRGVAALVEPPRQESFAPSAGQAQGPRSSPVRVVATRVVGACEAFLDLIGTLVLPSFVLLLLQP